VSYGPLRRYPRIEPALKWRNLHCLPKGAALIATNSSEATDVRDADLFRDHAGAGLLWTGLPVVWPCTVQLESTGVAPPITAAFSRGSRPAITNPTPRPSSANSLASVFSNSAR
jgi:hypothetical protein